MQNMTHQELRNEVEALRGQLMTHSLVLRQLIKQFPELRSQLADFYADPEAALRGIDASDVCREEALAEADILLA